MLLSPLQNNAVKILGGFIQARPKITQQFGENPEIYKRFGLRGHSGIDFRAPVGTPLFAPCEGTLKIIDDGEKGYGLHIEIIKSNVKVVLAHLSEVLVKDGEYVHLGDKIALTGNTGFSTAPHLHMTVKMLENGQTLNKDNGYFGAIPFLNLMVVWKGTFEKHTL